MAHKNKTQKYPVDTTSQNMSCLLLRLKPLQKKDVISAGSKQGFLNKPTIPHQPTIKAPPNIKN